MFKQFPILLEWNVKSYQSIVWLATCLTLWYYLLLFSPLLLVLQPHWLPCCSSCMPSMFLPSTFALSISTTIMFLGHFFPVCPCGLHISLRLGSNVISWDRVSLITLTTVILHPFSLLYFSACCLPWSDVKQCIYLLVLHLFPSLECKLHEKNDFICLLCCCSLST